MLVTWLIVDLTAPGLGAVRSLGVDAWVPEPIPFLAASLLLLAAYFVSAALWGRLVQDLGGPALPVSEAVSMFMIANVGRYIPGKIWQIAGLAALAKRRGVPAVTGAGAAVLGQGIALVAASSIGLGALLAAPPPYPTWGRVAAAVIGTLVVLLAIPPVFQALAGAWFRLARTSPPALRSVHALRWLVLYGANWVMYAVSFWLLAVSLRLEGGVVPVASAFAAAYVLGYVMVFAPAGLGPREGFLIAFLTPHFGAPHSGVIALVARLWTTAVELVPAAVFWARYVSAKRAEDERGDDEGQGA